MLRCYGKRKRPTYHNDSVKIILGAIRGDSIAALSGLMEQRVFAIVQD